MKMADVIIQNHHLLSIINRFGIKLGFGEQTVSEVCKSYDIPVSFFLEIVNAFNDPDFFPKKNMYSFPLKLIIEYLFKAHDYYINLKVPEIKSLIEQVANTKDAKTQKAVLLIQAFFDEYATQLKIHIEREEQKVYPYILELESVFDSKDQNKINDFKAKYNFRIDDYAKEHEDIEEKLYDIKNLIIKYIEPKDNYVIYFKILGQLAHLEEDINDHSEMENKVLIPRVRIMEEAIYS
jgi:regulator of cell morphogenesis and NO signaling